MIVVVNPKNNIKFEENSKGHHLKQVTFLLKKAPLFHLYSKSPAIKHFKSTGKFENKYSQSSPNKAVGKVFF